VVTPARSSSAQSSTRDKLIDAAFRVVARDGLEAASVKTIAAEAEVAPGLVHYHFPNKEAVLVAALRRGLADYVARESERRARLKPQDQVRAFFAAARGSAKAERDFFKVRLALAARALTSPELAAVMAEVNAAAVAQTAAVFAAAAGRNQPADSDRALASTLKAAFDGVMLSWIADPSFPIDQAGDVLERAATAWMSVEH
jgi:TetR/AcrR family transcriptional repressor of bet genes